MGQFAECERKKMITLYMYTMPAAQVQTNLPQVSGEITMCASQQKMLKMVRT